MTPAIAHIDFHILSVLIEYARPTDFAIGNIFPLAAYPDGEHLFRKVVIPIPSSGNIQVHAFTSNAEIPLRDVAVAITAVDGTAIAMRLTDRNGLIRAVEIPSPEKEESQSPNPDETPYTRINLYAHKKGYEDVESRNIQIFPDTTTYLDLNMTPLAEYPFLQDDTLVFQTPPQNL